MQNAEHALLHHPSVDEAIRRRSHPREPMSSRISALQPTSSRANSTTSDGCLPMPQLSSARRSPKSERAGQSSRPWTPRDVGRASMWRAAAGRHAAPARTPLLGRLLTPSAYPTSDEHKCAASPRPRERELGRHGTTWRRSRVGGARRRPVCGDGSTTRSASASAALARPLPAPSIRAQASPGQPAVSAARGGECEGWGRWG